jgi:3-phenylpropionate/cinnamic acid dioxygenase small subunit
VHHSETASSGHGDISRHEAEYLLFQEARLIDDWKLEEWLQLYTSDGLYWVPIDDSAPVASQGAIIYDNTLRREERVYHLLHTSFPAQSPNSRTVHVVTNVLVEPRGDDAVVSSSQIVYEMRPGDYSQRGIGDVVPTVARVEHVLRRVDGQIRIAEKKILLINRDTWQGNLTFIL